MSVSANISIDQGSDFEATVNVTDRNGDPLDLTGYTARGQIRRNYTSSTAIDFNIAITNATTGTILLSLSSGVTAVMRSQRYVYDVEIVDEDDIVTRVVEGQAEVNPRVTRPVEEE